MILTSSIRFVSFCVRNRRRLTIGLVQCQQSACLWDAGSTTVMRDLVGNPVGCFDGGSNKRVLCAGMFDFIRIPVFVSFCTRHLVFSLAYNVQVDFDLRNYPIVKAKVVTFRDTSVFKSTPATVGNPVSLSGNAVSIIFSAFL